MSNIISDLAKDRILVRIGDEVTYSDCCNYMTYTVSDIFDGGLELTALRNCSIMDGEKEDVYYDSLQLGWSLKISHNDRTTRTLMIESAR